ncbi:hypothetical protein BDW59DRAFT_98861 [Aspergillus cavernicola]|uniref:Uncharacterized protein n=1 Tax=Aspergillus cavernicola TaxID=176166 RepID=A0ABR4I6N7_9EURO
MRVLIQPQGRRVPYGFNGLPAKEIEKRAGCHKNVTFLNRQKRGDIGSGKGCRGLQKRKDWRKTESRVSEGPVEEKADGRDGLVPYGMVSVLVLLLNPIAIVAILSRQSFGAQVAQVPPYYLPLSYAYYETDTTGMGVVDSPMITKMGLGVLKMDGGTGVQSNRRSPPLSCGEG